MYTKRLLTKDSKGVVGTLTDKYGEERLVHGTRHGLRLARQRLTPALLANQAIAPLVSARLKGMRQARGWSLLEMAHKLGWSDGNPKERVWTIENNTRGEGVRLGTLFHFAKAFGVEVRDLLPTNAEIEAAMTAGSGNSEAE